MKATLAAILVGLLTLIGCVENSVSKAEMNTNAATKIQRKVFTPSGDWGGSIDYTYGKDGNLRHVSYDFSTFAGYDEVTKVFSSIRCVREYDVSKSGELILKSTVTTDLSTGKALGQRTFYEPPLKHWMTIAEANQGIREERVE